jgi:aminoglycoside phosphotransferase (APT) family kinase protein
VQKNLAPYYPVLPKMVALCQDESVIGCDFYVMERIEGIIPRAKLPPELGFNEEDVHELCVNVIDKLIELHQVPYENTPLAELGKGADIAVDKLKVGISVMKKSAQSTFLHLNMFENG